MKSSYVGVWVRVSIEVEYLANKSLDEELDTETDYLCIDTEASAELEVVIIEGVKHYSYSNFELTGKGLSDVEDAVDEFISENGYHLLGFDYYINRDNFVEE